MNLHNIKIPKPSIEGLSFSKKQKVLRDFYFYLIEDTQEGKEVLHELSINARVKKMEGRMVSSGFDGSLFSLKSLASWFLWAINEFGYEEADKNLNNYLDRSDIPVMNTLWILGVEVDEPIHLFDNMTLMPISMMPDSKEKKEFKKVAFSRGSFIPSPSSAIIMETEIVKMIDIDSENSNRIGGEGFIDSIILLNNVSMLLNIIEGVSCFSYFSKVYMSEEIPPGFFGVSESGSYRRVFDTDTIKTSKITSDIADEIKIVFRSFAKLPNKEKSKFGLILSRFIQSKQKNRIEDKILDLGIALEMALLDDNKNQHQLSLSFRLRGSWLIASNKDERLLIFRQLRDIYQYRSEVAHGGILAKNKREKIEKIRNAYIDYEKIGSRIIRTLICKGKPDWSKLILGIPAS